MEIYAKGISQRDIGDTIREIYGAYVSQGMISHITDKSLPAMNERRNRPLASVYPVIFFDWIVFNSRKDSRIITNVCYVLGINMEERKKIFENMDLRE